MFWNRDPMHAIAPWTAEPQGDVQREARLSPTTAISADAPRRMTSACPVLPLPHIQSPLRLSASWTSNSSAPATAAATSARTSTSSYPSSPSSTSSYDEDDLEGDEGLIALFPVSAARADPIAPFTGNPPWRSQLQFPPPPSQRKPSKSSRLLGITPTDAKFPHSVTLSMDSPSPTLKAESDSPTAPAFPSFPCQREQVVSQVVLEGRVIKAQKQISTSTRSFLWRKASGKRQVLLTSTVGGLRDSLATAPTQPPPSASTSSGSTFSVSPALTEGCPPIACLHAFKPSAPEQEVERLVLTPQSFIAVASGSPDANDDCITSLLWAVRVSGVHFDHRGITATSKMQEWFLQLDTQREMVIWQSTIRSIIKSLARIDAHFRLGSPQEQRRQQEEYWSSCLSPPPLSASFSHTSSSPMPFTPPSGSHIAAPPPVMESPMILPSSAEPLSETVRKLNLATAEARKIQSATEPVKGGKAAIVKETTEPPKRPPRPPSPLTIFIPRNEQAVKAVAVGGEAVTPARSVTATVSEHDDIKRATTPVQQHANINRPTTPVKPRPVPNQAPATPAPTPTSTPPTGSVKDSPTFGWTVDVSQSPDEFYERHVSPVTHWRGRWGGRGPMSAASSVSAMALDVDDCEEKIRDSLDLERGDEGKQEERVDRTVAPPAPAPSEVRRVAIVPRSRSGSVSSVASAATLPPPRPPPVTPLPDVPRMSRPRSTSVGERHVVPHSAPMSAPPTAWKGAMSSAPPLPLPSAPHPPPRSASLYDRHRLPAPVEGRGMPSPQLAVSLGMPPRASPPALSTPSPEGGQSNFLNLSDGGLDSAGSSILDVNWPTAAVPLFLRPRRRNTTAHTYEVKKSLWEVVYFASRYSAPHGGYGDDHDLVTPTSPPL